MKAMKYMIASFVAAFLMAILFAGCKKEQDMLQHDTSAAPIMSQTLPVNYEGYGPAYTDLTREAPNIGRMRTFYHIPSMTYYSIDAGGWITIPEVMFCAPPKGTCFPTVVIVAERANEFCKAGRLLQKLHKQNRVSEFFSGNDYKKIFPEMDLMPNVLDSLRAGNISLHLFHNEADSVDFYVGLPGNQYGCVTSEDLDFLNVRCVLRMKNE